MNLTDLGPVGLSLAADERDALCGMAADLRALHKRHATDDPEDVLLELADQLDMIGMPIVVEPTPRGCPCAIYETCQVCRPADRIGNGT